MMRFFVFLLGCFLLFSCNNDSDNGFTAVSIERVFEDSLDIRAIVPVDANKVWFAANAGRVGLIDEKTPKLAVIKYADSLLHFRAMAATDKAMFVLSIANPAVLYKIGFNEKGATSIEEVYVEEGEKVFYDAMIFWDNKEGIAMGDSTDGCLSVLITRDGGGHWKKTPCSDLPDLVPGEAAFAASNSNIAVYKNHAWIATGGKAARVFHTADKGKNWEVFETPIVQGGAMTGIYSIDFFDEKPGLFLGAIGKTRKLTKQTRPSLLMGARLGNCSMMEKARDFVPRCALCRAVRAWGLLPLAHREFRIARTGAKLGHNCPRKGFMPLSF